MNNFVSTIRRWQVTSHRDFHSWHKIPCVKPCHFLFSWKYGQALQFTPGMVQKKVQETPVLERDSRCLSGASITHEDMENEMEPRLELVRISMLLWTLRIDDSKCTYFQCKRILLVSYLWKSYHAKQYFHSSHIKVLQEISCYLSSFTLEYCSFKSMLTHCTLS